MRADRSRAALRENLKRRKAQAKQRQQPRGAHADKPARGLPPSHETAGFVPDKPKG